MSSRGGVKCRYCKCTGGWDTDFTRFHCLFCHGYEESGADSAGVLAMDMLASVPHATMVSRFAARLAKKVTVYTNGNKELAETLEGSFGTPTVSVDARKVAHLEKVKSRPGIVLHFDDGTEKEERFLVSGSQESKEHIPLLIRNRHMHPRPL